MYIKNSVGSKTEPGSMLDATKSHLSAILNLLSDIGITGVIDI